MSTLRAGEDRAVDGLVSVRIGPQIFGVPVLRVQDVVAAGRIDLIPRAPPEVAGAMNLRGRIVTAIDMRKRLGLPPRAAGEGRMSVIVERSGELYALQVDDVGDVLWLPCSERLPCPPGVSPEWRSLCDGLYRLEGELMLVLQIDQTLTLDHTRPLAA